MMKINEAGSEEKNKKTVKIFGVKVTGTSVSIVLKVIGKKLLKKEKFLIVTPNPEIVLMAHKDQDLLRILNNAAISLIDGVGLIHARKFLSLPCPNNKFFRLAVLLFNGLRVGLATFLARNWLEEGFKVIKGKEMFITLLGLANKQGWRVVLLGDRLHSAQRAQSVLEKSFKKVKIFSFDGPNLDKKGQPTTNEDARIEEKVIKEINTLKPHLLFVGFGAPKQEKWSARLIPELAVGGVMVLGRTFEWVSGRSKIAPAFLGKAGLEWLWRLLTGSTNVGRIWLAVVVFPLKVLHEKLAHH